MEKHKLTESFIITGKIDKVSSVDTKLIKNHILSNFTLDARYNDDQYTAAMEMLPNIFDTKSDKADKAWLEDTTEKWCQDRAIHNAIMESITIIDGKHQTLTKNALPDILSQALAVSFDTNIGHDYIENVGERYDFYHEQEERIPFDLEFFNKIIF